MVGEDEAAALARAVRLGEISRGESIPEFESGFAELIGGGEASVALLTIAIDARPL